VATDPIERGVLGARGPLAAAFRQIAKAITWWYGGPGSFMHCVTGPHEYSDDKPFCCAGPQCVRCQRAVIARAAGVHVANRRANYGDAHIPDSFRSTVTAIRPAGRRPTRTRGAA